MKDRSVLDKKSVEAVKQLTRMIGTGATPQQIGNVVIQDRDLRDSVKAVLPRDNDIDKLSYEAHVVLSGDFNNARTGNALDQQIRLHAQRLSLNKI